MDVVGTRNGEFLVGELADPLNRVWGLGGDDTLYGTSTRDELRGGNGDDWILAPAGQRDLVDGGEGEDFLRLDLSMGSSFSFIASLDPSVQVTLANGTTIVGIERFEIIGSNAADTIAGAEAADALRGEAGNDLLLGRGGNDSLTDTNGADTIDGEAGDDSISASAVGADYLVGGAGVDVLGYDAASLNNVSIVIDLTPDAISRFSGGTRVHGFERYNIYVTDGANLVQTGNDADTISGRGGENTLDGRAGNDIVSVYQPSGKSVLRGGSGDDTLSAANSSTIYTLDGGDGDDVLYGGLGRGRIAGSSGIDTAHLQFASAITAIIADSPSDTSIFSDGTRIKGVEHFVIAASVAADHIETGAGDDRILGGGGRDTLAGGAGNDTIETYAVVGTTVIRGNEGNDSVVLSPVGQFDVDGGAGADTMAVDLAERGTGIIVRLDLAEGTITGGSKIVDFETFRIRGTDNADQILTGAGNDTIDGFYGADTLDGGGGNDSIQNGVDVKGGVGNDSLLGYTNGLDKFFDGGDGNDSLQIAGSFAGDSETDTLSGGAGNDTIVGVRGLIDGGAGTDAGGFLVNAGTSNMLIDVKQLAAGVTFDALGLTIRNVEQGFLRTGSGADTLIGAGLNDTLDGNAGSDSLTGGDGNDSLVSGFGMDTMSGGAGSDTLTVVGTLSGGIGIDSQPDQFSGDAGDDQIGLFGPGRADGGTGNDTLSVIGLNVGQSQGLDIALSTAAGTWHQPATGFSYRDIEAFEISGTSWDDRIIGSTGADTIYGEFGHDWLAGAEGNDLLAGWGGDTMRGGSGDDTLAIGGEGHRLTGGSGADVFLWENAGSQAILRDFQSGTDRIGIRSEGFWMDPDEVTLVTGTDPTPTGNGPTFLFDTDSGILRFDWSSTDGVPTMILGEFRNVTSLTLDDFIFL